MKAIAFVFVLLMACTVYAAPPAPPADLTREKTVTAGEVIPENFMQKYVLHNTGAEATIEITLDTPVRYVSFWVSAWAAQTIEVDFPADANPYLDGAQIGADNEIDVPAGATLYIEYRPSDGTWRCFRVWGVPVDGAEDD